MNVAIVGSRQYPFLDDVKALVGYIASDRPDATIISGGALGVDTAAETTAIQLGLKVLSYRAVALPGRDGHGLDTPHGIEEWSLGGDAPAVRVMVEEMTFADYVSALFYRNMLIMDRADRVVGFWNGYSAGTRDGLTYARDRKKPVKVYGVNSDRLRLSEESS